MTPQHVLEVILREHDAGRASALCAVVATRGSTPQPAGVMICVDESANITGTLGGGCVEADVRRLAHQQLGVAAGQLVTFKLDDDFGYDDGMICGGEMDIAICPFNASADLKAIRTAVGDLTTGAATIPIRIEQDGQQLEYRVHAEAAPKLMIAGAGHISRVLARIAEQIGFEVHVIDDRSDYASATRFPSPIVVHVGNIAPTLQTLVQETNAYVVIVTRGHRNDEAALSAVLGSRAKYLGMIGSRRKIKVIFDDLRQTGADEESLARVHAPIGLKIDAVTADEIAVSIAAELISIRRANHKHTIEGPVPVHSP